MELVGLNRSSRAGTAAANRHLAPVCALIAAEAISGIFMGATRAVRIGRGFVDRIGGSLCLGLLVAGSAPSPD